MTLDDIVRETAERLAAQQNEAALQLFRAKARNPALSVDDLKTGTHDVCGESWLKHELVLLEVPMHERLVERDGKFYARPDGIPVRVDCPGDDTVMRAHRETL